MRSMFDGALSYNHDLCSWANRFQNEPLVDSMFSMTSCRRTENPNFSVTPPGPFCHVCEASPQYACFSSSEELQMAVDQYEQDPSSIIGTYGPIEQWCVGQVEDFSGLFAASRNPAMEFFNRDITRWDTSAATSMVLML